VDESLFSGILSLVCVGVWVPFFASGRLDGLATAKLLKGIMAANLSASRNINSASSREACRSSLVLIITLSMLWGWAPVSSREMQASSVAGADVPESVGFDLLLLVRSWSPTFCLELHHEGRRCSIEPVEAFTLHGLWPEFIGGGWPEYCPHHGNDTKIHITSRMKCEWPSFGGENAYFWMHELLKHGSCMEKLLMNSSNYFDTALELNERYDLNGALHDFIDTQSHDMDIIETNNFISFIESGSDQFVEGSLLASCTAKEELNEMWMCLDLQLKAQKCPSDVQPRRTCREYFYLPVGSHVSRNCSRYFPPFDEDESPCLWRRMPWILGMVLFVSLLAYLAIFSCTINADSELGYSSML